MRLIKSNYLNDGKLFNDGRPVDLIRIEHEGDFDTLLNNIINSNYYDNSYFSDHIDYKEKTVKFDAFLLKMFVSIVGIYPAGTMILLSTDELAVVIRNNSGDLSRPVVKIVGDRKGPWTEYREIDLLASENILRKIVRIIDPKKYNIDIKNIILSDK